MFNRRVIEVGVFTNRTTIEVRLIDGRGNGGIESYLSKIGISRKAENLRLYCCLPINLFMEPRLSVNQGSTYLNTQAIYLHHLLTSDSWTAILEPSHQMASLLRSFTTRLPPGCFNKQMPQSEVRGANIPITSPTSAAW